MSQATGLSWLGIFRLGLVQSMLGAVVVLTTSTLNRVMVVEMGVPAWLVSVMVSLPLLFAPLRALIGHRSDQHRSYLGWRRVPYIWGGTMAQFGGLSIMPFALILLSGDNRGPEWLGPAASARQSPRSCSRKALAWCWRISTRPRSTR